MYLSVLVTLVEHVLYLVGTIFFLGVVWFIDSIPRASYFFCSIHVNCTNYMTPILVSPVVKPCLGCRVEVITSILFQVGSRDKIGTAKVFSL